MTAQVMDNIIFEGKEHSLAAEPLRPYLSTRDDIKFQGLDTACWRGYVATWEILNDQLYLTGLSGNMSTKNKDDGSTNLASMRHVSSVDALFPDSNGKVFADWYSGEIRVPQGELLQYVHMGYGSLYEKDLIMQLKDGVVTSTEVKDYREEYSKLSDTDKHKLGQQLKYNS